MHSSTLCFTWKQLENDGAFSKFHLGTGRQEKYFFACCITLARGGKTCRRFYGWGLKLACITFVSRSHWLELSHGASCNIDKRYRKKRKWTLSWVRWPPGHSQPCYTECHHGSDVFCLRLLSRSSWTDVEPSRDSHSTLISSSWLL